MPIYSYSYNRTRILSPRRICPLPRRHLPSPIGLHTTSGLAHTHTPDFSGYSTEVSGTFFNWGFGPAYTLKHEGSDFTTLPALKFDDRTVYLSGWHTHFPSEHLVDRVRSRAEMHFVHVDAAGKAASVVGIRIDVSTHTSKFFEALPADLIHFNDTSVLDGVLLNPMAAIEEVGGVQEYWDVSGQSDHAAVLGGVEVVLAEADAVGE